MHSLYNLGKGIPGTQPKGGLIGGGAGSNSWSGMVGSNERGQNRQILRLAFGNNAYRTTTDEHYYPLVHKKINVAGDIVDYHPKLTPFRVAMNAGDIFGTVNESADKHILPHPANQVTTTRKSMTFGWKNAAGGVKTTSNGSAYVGNAKYVYSGEDYVRYKKLQAINKNYNDLSFGGDQSNASQSALRFVRHS